MVEIERMLLAMGARPSRRGYVQAMELLDVLRERKDVEHLSDVYALVAQRMHASPQQIDRNLRAIIHEIWQIGDQALLLQLMPWCSKTCPPSNKEFLCAMAAHLRAGDWKANGPWQENRAETPQDQTQDDERQKEKRQAGRRRGPSTGR